jgi:hypothetical protein
MDVAPTNQVSSKQRVTTSHVQNMNEAKQRVDLKTTSLGFTRQWWHGITKTRHHFNFSDRNMSNKFALSDYPRTIGVRKSL